MKQIIDQLSLKEIKDGYMNRREQGSFEKGRKPHNLIRTESKVSPIQKSEKRTDKPMIKEKPIEDDFEVKKKQPEIMSKEAMNVVKGKKHLILGSKNCGHCKNQDRLIKGNYRAVILKKNDKNKYEIDTQWGEYHQTLAVTKDSIKELDKLLKQGLIKQMEYIRLKQQASHLLDINETMINKNLDYDKVRKNYQIMYVDDLESNDIKPFKPLLDQFKQRKITKDQLLTTLKKSQGSEKLVNYLIANEIADVYGLKAFPTFIKDSCDIPQVKNIEQLVKQGKTKGLLANCTDRGFKEPIDFISYDAEQRGDKKTLKKIQDIQDLKRKKITDYPDLKEIVDDLSEIKLS